MRTPSQAIGYIRRLFAPEDALLRQMEENLKARFPALYPIQIGAEEGKMLQLFIRLAGVKSIIEVGSLAGYSAVWMARALPEDGVLYAINNDPAHAVLAREHFAASEVAHKLVMHEGNGMDVLPTLEARGPFDMIFIDADKPGYIGYLDWAERHIRKGGLIIGDNTLLFGHIWDEAPPQGEGAPSRAAWQAMREFNRRLADPERYLSTLIPTEEGMTVALKIF